MHMENNTKIVFIILINNIRINSVFHVLTTVSLLLPTPVYGYNVYDRT